MRPIKSYPISLLAKYNHLMLLSIGGMGLFALTTLTAIVWSFGQYRQATQNTYVFHHKGAAISIYDERSHPVLVKVVTTTPFLRNR